MYKDKIKQCNMNQGHLRMVGVHSAVVRVRTERKLSKMSHVSAATECRTYSTKHIRPQIIPVALRAYIQQITTGHVVTQV